MEAVIVAIFSPAFLGKNQNDGAFKNSLKSKKSGDNSRGDPQRNTSNGVEGNEPETYEKIDKVEVEKERIYSKLQETNSYDRMDKKVGKEHIYVNHNEPNNYERIAKGEVGKEHIYTKHSDPSNYESLIQGEQEEEHVYTQTKA